MSALHNHEFPVPVPIDQNRHAILMSLCEGFPMTQVRHIEEPEVAYNDMMDLILRLGKYGLIHGDFNEYNLILGYDEKITLIDFPQMISTKHPNAKTYFDRDCQGVADFFRNRLGYHGSEVPSLEDIGDRLVNLDREVEASGFSEKDGKAFDQLVNEQDDTGVGKGGDSGEVGEVEEEGEGGVEGVGGVEGETKAQPHPPTTSEKVVSLISLVALDTQQPPAEETDTPPPPTEVTATSFLDQASLSHRVDTQTESMDTSAAATVPALPTPTKPRPPIAMSEAEIKEKVRRAIQKKKGGKGSSKGKKNQNKNREKRRNMQVVKNDR